MLTDVQVFIVCVDYADALSISLPYNQHHFDSITVITHPRDKDTINVAEAHGACVFQTEVFYERGAVFNKFAALEDVLRQKEPSLWVAIVDADILFPQEEINWSKVKGNLYVPRRRMLPFIPVRLAGVPPHAQWDHYGYPHPDEEFAGYCQIFHAGDPVLGSRPWYRTDWTWAGGPDSFFHQKWSDVNKVRPPFEVLHMGPSFTNWAGRVSAFSDGTVPAEAAERLKKTHELMAARRGPGGREVFDAEILR